MTIPTELSKKQLSRQVRQHLDSLKAAGVDWLPAGSIPIALQGWSQTQDSKSAKPQAVLGRPAMDQTTETPLKGLFADVGGPDPTMAAKPATSAIPLEQRKQELKLLTEKVSQCTRCAELASTRTQTVFGVGPVGAELCFIGEAPGADEDAQGEPFVGAAGQLLDKIIAACKMKREEVYLQHHQMPPARQPHAAAQRGRQLSRVFGTAVGADSTQIHLRFRVHGGQISAEYKSGHRPAPRAIPRLSRHPRDVHLSPRVSLAASKSGKEERCLGRYEDAVGQNGEAGDVMDLDDFGLRTYSCGGRETRNRDPVGRNLIYLTSLSLFFLVCRGEAL